MAAAFALILMATAAPAAQRSRAGLPAQPGNPFGALQNVSGLAVYDANGTKVGDVVGLLDMSVPVVAFAVGDQRFVLRVFEQHVFGVRVVFEAPGCAGPVLLTAPFFDSPNRIGTSFALAGVAGPGRTVYLSDPGAVARNVSYRSRLTVDGLCITSSFTSPASVVSGTPLVDLDTLYSAPFSVR
jgi:hypothetical protein